MDHRMARRARPAAAPASDRRPSTTRCCGTTASAARAAAPRPGRGCTTLIRISTSSGAALAYSTKTSKYRLSSNTPVSSSSYSSSCLPRLRLVATRSSYGIGRLRVLVQVLHVRVRRRAVEVEVVLLDVLAVVALAVGQPEGTLLEDRVLAVPQRQREAQHLVVVADAGQAVLAPAVGARPRLVVGEVVPGVAVVAVVLAHRAPLPLAQVGSPLLPGNAARLRLVEPFLLRVFAHYSFSVGIRSQETAQTALPPRQYPQSAVKLRATGSRTRFRFVPSEPTPGRTLPRGVP